MRVVVVGAGRVGLSVATLLADTGDYDVLVGECTEEGLSEARSRGVAAQYVDAARSVEVQRLLAGADVVVAAVPDQTVLGIAQVAATASLHYLDFSEASRDVLDASRRMPDNKAFLPGCGVSPGLVDAIALGMTRWLDPGFDLEVRVGAIPVRRTNRLGYGVIWNLDGLIAEYTGQSAAIVNGKHVDLPSLSGRIEFAIDDVEYEAFHTSGSIDALRELVTKRAHNLTFRTIRYPGHLDYMQFLLDDLDLQRDNYGDRSAAITMAGRRQRRVVSFGYHESGSEATASDNYRLF